MKHIGYATVSIYDTMRNPVYLTSHHMATFTTEHGFIYDIPLSDRDINEIRHGKIAYIYITTQTVGEIQNRGLIIQPQIHFYDN